MPCAPKTKITRVTRVTKVTEPFFCTDPNCGMEFERKADFSRHMLSHGENRPFRCHYPDCNFSATQRGGLETHFNKHTGARPFKCPYCDDRHFSDKSSRARHMKKAHSDKYTPAPRKSRVKSQAKKSEGSSAPCLSQSAGPSATSKSYPSTLSSYPSAQEFYSSPLSSSYSSTDFYPSPLSASSSSSSSSSSFFSQTSPMAPESPEVLAAAAAEQDYFTPSPDFFGAELPYPETDYLTQPIIASQPTTSFTPQPESYFLPGPGAIPSTPVQKPADADFFYMDALCGMGSPARPARGTHRIVSSEYEASYAGGQGEGFIFGDSLDALFVKREVSIDDSLNEFVAWLGDNKAVQFPPLSEPAIIAPHNMSTVGSVSTDWIPYHEINPFTNEYN